ncbi:hypothetical protein Tco_0479188 [Tanacetum coccineum]
MFYTLSCVLLQMMRQCHEVEGEDVEGEKSDEDATDEEDEGNETDKDTNANLEERDDVLTDDILPQAQATQEIEDTHETLTPYTGVDAILVLVVLVLVCRRTYQLGDEGLSSAGTKLISIFITDEVTFTKPM